MSARASLPLSLAVFTASLCSTACDESLKSVSTIEDTRVLGARVESAANPQRGSPNPGEQASLGFFLAAPDGNPRFSYALSVCAVQLTNNGFPPCDSPPFASTVQPEPSDGEARLVFSVPADIELERTPHAFARARICPDSGLNLGSDGSPSCDTGGGIEVAYEFALGGTEYSNLNPSFAADALLLDGAPWPASSEASCEDAQLPRVSMNSLHALNVSLADADFEFLSQSTPIDPAREQLLVSPFSTAGKFEHGFLSLRADGPPEQGRVNWVAPNLTDGRPELVRFYFVVRDARSGEDFANRALCVVP